MTINEYANFTGTPIHTVKTWIGRGLPHTPTIKADIDPDEAAHWIENVKGKYQRRK